MTNHIPISFKRKKSRDYRRSQLGLKRGRSWQNRWYDDDEINQGDFETYKEGDVRDLLDAVIKGYVMEDPIPEENNKVLPNDYNYEKKYPKYPPKRA